MRYMKSTGIIFIITIVIIIVVAIFEILQLVSLRSQTGENSRERIETAWSTTVNQILYEYAVKS